MHANVNGHGRASVHTHVHVHEPTRRSHSSGKRSWRTAASISTSHVHLPGLFTSRVLSLPSLPCFPTLASHEILNNMTCTARLQPRHPMCIFLACTCMLECPLRASTSDTSTLSSKQCSCPRSCPCPESSSCPFHAHVHARARTGVASTLRLSRGTICLSGASGDCRSLCPSSEVTIKGDGSDLIT